MVLWPHVPIKKFRIASLNFKIDPSMYNSRKRIIELLKCFEKIGDDRVLKIIWHLQYHVCIRYIVAAFFLPHVYMLNYSPISLPGCPGLQLLRRLRVRFHNAPTKYSLYTSLETWLDDKTSRRYSGITHTCSIQVNCTWKYKRKFLFLKQSRHWLHTLCSSWEP